MEFSKVAVLGGGLLGGSLALALRGRMSCALWARRDATVEEALSIGIEGATPNLSEAVDGAGLVILAVPVGVMPTLLDAAIGAGLSSGAVISDVGSVKAAVHAALGPLAEKAGACFIGGHPMAGSEQQGLAAARADLFEGAPCLLTDDEGVGAPAAERLEHFWKALGCRVSWTDAAAHDRLVARISHLPHMMASAAAAVALEQPGDAIFAGGGLRDTTRVASGDPAMWAEILVENAAALAAPLRAARDQLSETLAMLEANDEEALRRWLGQARELHQAGLASRREQDHE